MFASFDGLIGYIGPETILPFSSIIAAIGGGVMLFWNSLRRAAGRVMRGCRRRSAAGE